MTQCLSVTNVTSTLIEDVANDNKPDEVSSETVEIVRSKTVSMSYRLPAQPTFKKPWTPPSKGILVPRKTKGIPRSKNIAETLLMKLATTSQRKRGIVKEESSSLNNAKKVQWSQCPAVCDTWDLTRRTHQDLVQDISQLNTQHISPLQRCKWIFSADNSGNPDIGASIWSEVCAMIGKGLLPHCNACLKENQEVWVYCDSNNAVKVYETLKETFNLPHKLTLHIIGNTGNRSFDLDNGQFKP